MNINKDLKIPLNGGLDGCLLFNKDQFFIGTIQTIDGEGERLIIQATVNRVSDKMRVHDLGAVTCVAQGDTTELNRPAFEAYQTAVKTLTEVINTALARAGNTEGATEAAYLAEAAAAQKQLDGLVMVELQTTVKNTYAEVMEYVKPGKLTVAGNQWLKAQVLSSGLVINELLK